MKLILVCIFIIFSVQLALTQNTVFNLYSSNSYEEDTYQFVQTSNPKISTTTTISNKQTIYYKVNTTNESIVSFKGAIDSKNNGSLGLKVYRNDSSNSFNVLSSFENDVKFIYCSNTVYFTIYNINNESNFQIQLTATSNQCPLNYYEIINVSGDDSNSNGNGSFGNKLSLNFTLSLFVMFSLFLFFNL